MDCVDPPLNAAPPGDWRCPLCAVLPDGDCDGGTDNGHAHRPTDAARAIRRIYLALARHRAARARPAGTGPTARAEEHRGQDTHAPRPRCGALGWLGRGRPAACTPAHARTARQSTKARAASSDDADDDAEVDVEADIGESPRRRVRQKTSTAPVVDARLKLRVPRGGKGKAREDDELPSPQGLFDDVLGVAERDTSRTTPSAADKLAFERSLLAAEVRRALFRFYHY